ncbi:MAG: alpha/beta hydrolase family esterase [Bacteriovoracales bacterium]
MLLSLPLFAEVTTIEVEGHKSATVYLPTDFAHKKDLPLVISLHGVMSNPKIQEKIFPAKNLIDKKGFILITPFGKRNYVGLRFWNASEQCCDFFKQNPDDISYLRELIIKALKKFSIDPKKVFLVGHSNGGILAYRFACEASDLISGIVSIAGPNVFEEINCNPSKPISILHIHGKNDRIIKYDGNLKRGFPSALDSILPWSKINNCQGMKEFNYTQNISKLRFIECDKDKSVELWTLNNRNHNKSLGNELTQEILNYLF